jgi:hypothetical protein
MKFGIELEICINIEDLEDLHKKGLIFKDLKYKDYNERYDKWFYTEDISVECLSQTEIIVPIGSDIKEIQGRTLFRPIEIVSKIYDESELETFCQDLQYYLDPNFTWLINSTTDLHVTISEDLTLQESFNLLAFWILFEKMFFYLVNKSRRNNKLCKSYSIYQEIGKDDSFFGMRFDYSKKEEDGGDGRKVDQLTTKNCKKNADEVYINFKNALLSIFTTTISEKNLSLNFRNDMRDEFFGYITDDIIYEGNWDEDEYDVEFVDDLDEVFDEIIKEINKKAKISKEMKILFGEDTDEDETDNYSLYSKLIKIIEEEQDDLLEKMLEELSEKEKADIIIEHFDQTRKIFQFKSKKNLKFEFRTHETTLNIDDIKGWLKLCLEVVSTAKEEPKYIIINEDDEDALFGSFLITQENRAPIYIYDTGDAISKKTKEEISCLLVSFFNYSYNTNEIQYFLKFINIFSKETQKYIISKFLENLCSLDNNNFLELSKFASELQKKLIELN